MIAACICIIPSQYRSRQRINDYQKRPFDEVPARIRAHYLAGCDGAHPTSGTEAGAG